MHLPRTLGTSPSIPYTGERAPTGCTVGAKCKQRTHPAAQRAVVLLSTSTMTTRPESPPMLVRGQHRNTDTTTRRGLRTHGHGAPAEVRVLLRREAPRRENLRVLALADQLRGDADLRNKQTQRSVVRYVFDLTHTRYSINVNQKTKISIASAELSNGWVPASAGASKTNIDCRAKKTTDRTRAGRRSMYTNDSPGVVLETAACASCTRAPKTQHYQE